MPVPTVQFLGGVREIGGNKLVVEDGGDRVLFDFGPSFSPRYEQFYLDFLQPRSTSPIRDLLEFELIPWVPGLYSREALAGIEDRYESPRFGAVFVSHAHIDHAGYLRHLDPEIPVHVGKGTKVVLEAIEESSPGTKYGDHAWRTFVDGRSVRVGNLEVVPLPVDHSVPHAYGFLIRTRAGTFVYTGDFRQHGPRAELTHDFLGAAAKEEPVALAIEGTRAGPDPRKNFTEEGVRSGIVGELGASDRLALVSCYPRDVDRLGTLYRAAVASGRDLIVPLKAAHLLQALADDERLNVPVPGRSPHLHVYRRPKKRYATWEKELLDSAVDAEWVQAHARESLLLLDMHQFTELIDLRPERGSPFIRSMSEPFSEEDGNEAVLQNWLAHIGLPLRHYHASGHCSSTELAAAIRTVHPKWVFPIHTEHPEAFEPGSARLVPPERGVVYDLATGSPVR